MKEHRSKLFLLNTDFLRAPDVFDSVFSRINKARREIIQKYKNENARIASAAASVVLEYALESFGIDAGSAEFIYNKHGKPYLKDKKVFFNLSHSKSAVICSVSDRETGADIEDISEPVYQIADRYFCPSEKELLKSITDTDEKARTFYRLWTIKESVLKAIGCGITIPLNSFCIDLNSDHVNVLSEEIKETIFFREYHISDDFCISSSAYEKDSLPEKTDYIDLSEKLF